MKLMFFSSSNQPCCSQRQIINTGIVPAGHSPGFHEPTADRSHAQVLYKKMAKHIIKKKTQQKHPPIFIPSNTHPIFSRKYILTHNPDKGDSNGNISNKGKVYSLHGGMYVRGRGNYY